MKKKEKIVSWVVRAYSTGWHDLRRFNNPSRADRWLCDYVKRNKYSMEDFTIVRREE